MTVRWPAHEHPRKVAPTPMSSRLRTVAVVLAGGTGSRVGLNIPKQLLKVAGKTILEHTLDVFQDAPEIDEIVVLMNGDYLAEARRLAAPYSKVSTVEAGGSTRNETTHTALTALSALGDDDCKVLFHDAVRPLLDHRIITETRRRAGPVRRGRRRDPLRRHDHRGRRAGRDHRRPRPQPHPPRPDAAGVPRSPRSAAPTSWPGRTRTSPPPTTAAWCCATCPTCRSAWSTAPSRT